MDRRIVILVAVALSIEWTVSKKIPGKRQVVSSDCGGNSDVVFVVDGSDSVGKDNFNKEIDFVKNTVSKWNVGPTGMHVGLVTYGDTAKNQFYPNAYTTNNDIQAALGRATFVGGKSNAAEAIEFAYKNSLDPLRGARSKSPHTIVLVTNSGSSQKDLTLLESKTAKDNGNVIYTVGIGGGIDASELSQVSSDPDSRYFLKVDNFQSLGTIADFLARKTCNEISTDPNFLPTPTSCLKKADLVFMLDSSSSVGTANFQKLEGFLKEFVKTVDVGPDAVHVAVSQFSSYPTLDVSLDKYSNRTDLMTAIGNINYIGGGTNTADALKFLRQNVLASGRDNVPHIGILITDGKSSSTAHTTEEANAAHKMGVGLISVGVGSDADRLELNAIASDPDSQNVFTVGSYDQLNTLVSKIMTAACRVQPSTLVAVQTQTKGPDLCVDKLTNCDRYGKKTCSQYTEWSKVNCPNYCGFCHSLYTTTAAPCVDKLTNCDSYGKSACTNFIPWARENCQVYCGFCSAGTAHTGFYGKCFYKGKPHAHGEKWQDGCDYECTCIDGQSGKYQCYNRCPVYYNLPADCTLVRKPGDCCLHTVCNFKPTINEVTGSGSGIYNGISVCVYKGKNYYQGQQWEDGCDSTCTCTDANSGEYKCADLCGTYGTLPSTCSLQKTPGKCCSRPMCEFKQQQGSFTGYGAISGQGLVSKPTDPPPCKDELDNCATYGTSVCKNYVAWSQTNCRKYCNLCGDGHVHASASDRCLFNGNSYSQGQTWKVNCDTQCVCENAIYGYYRCLSTCPTYNNLPAGCTVKNVIGQCCPSVVCSAGTFLSSSTNLNTIGNGGMISSGTGNGGEYVPPTLPSGVTAQPGTGGTGFQAPKLSGCLYNGNVYAKHQRWNDECSKSCECLDDTTGLYSCRPRCPSYSKLPTECTMVTDPNDNCCKMPHCTGKSANFVAVPSFAAAVTGHSAVMPPTQGELWKGVGAYTILQSGATVPQPTGDGGVLGGLGYCMYKGKQYLSGETWEDGCDYNCVCDDARYGHYTCTDKCRKYESLPKLYCHLVPDPENSCCKIPFCNFTAPYQGFTGFASLNPSTHAPILTTPLATPGIPFCVYNGKHYSQGQQWYDGCSFKCKCDDSVNNKYTCLTRCPEYENVAPGCTLVPDPQDPTCCKMPKCSPAMLGTPTPGTGLVPALPTVPVGSVTGTGTKTSGSGPVGHCEYDGKVYQQGERWEDGCTYNCECKDAQTGEYKCTEKCARYEHLPPNCRLVSDFTNPCCKVPRCDLSGNQGSQTGSGTPSPGGTPHTVTGPTPTPSFCEYKNVRYAQGQEWQDGCELRCRCDNAAKGIYTCNQRCPKYDTPKGDCKMVTDPKDACCLIPVCTYNPGTPHLAGQPTPGNGITPPIGIQTPGPGHTPGTVEGSTPLPGHEGHPTPFPIPTAVPGKIEGSVKVPVPTPGPDGVIPSPVTIRSCEYKGSQYGQGQKWRDGCDYECECTNALSGKYECTELCPRFVNLPSYCTLVKDPAKPCCDVPDCTEVPATIQPPTPGIDGTPLPGHSPTPGGGSTPLQEHSSAPHLAGTPKPGIDATPAPRYVCVYKGKSYTQGQSWYDGCDYKCVCENGAEGVYTCNQRCASFDNLPSQCTLVADPQDPFCCKMPQCTFHPTHDNQTGYNLLPTLPTGSVVGGKATNMPTPTPANFYGPTPVGFKFPTVPPGVSTPYPAFTPTPYTDYTFFPHFASTPKPAHIPTPGATLAPNAKQMCIYKGKTYSEGQRWQDGCEYDCVCENGMTGVYKCTEKCHRYGQIPSSCKMVRDYLNPCCEKPYCDFRPTVLPPTLTPKTTPGNQAPQPTQPPEVCVYRGVSYAQGATWQDGCDLKCVCEDAKKGYYRCDHRCLKYDNIPSTCSLKTNPQDSCCKIPVCSPSIPSTPAPGTDQTPLPGVSTHSPGQTPLIVPGVSPGANPNPLSTAVPFPVPTAVPGRLTGTGVNPDHNPKDNTTAGCLYKSVLYKVGQKWQDGCDFNCQCMDQTGKYTCLERCLKYQQLPAYCMLVPDDHDPCCQKPSCLPPAELTTPAPYHTPNTNLPSLPPGVTPTQAGTPAPHTLVPPQPKAVCVYKGSSYTQGQQWYDACDKVCVCENANTGFYRCSDRCTQYKNIAPECMMIADPKDPACCQVPQCVPIPGQPGFSTPKPGAQPTVVTNVPGFVTGKAPVIAATPTPGPDGKIPTPGVGQTPAPTSGCEYKGAIYAQGQKWQDGCKFKCICDDGKTGLYTCDERCPSYPNLPPQCHLVADPKDYCCYVSVCDYLKPVATPGPVFNTPLVVGHSTPLPGSTMNPPMIQTPSPGATYPPGYTPTTAGTPNIVPTIPPNPMAFCVYQGVPYKQGQAWQDGCSQKCRCEDAVNNYYTCFDRCPSYDLKAGCVLVTDPSDPCCQTPQCTYVPTPGPQQTPAPGKTYPPGVTPSLGPGQTPPPMQTAVPSPIPTAIPGHITGSNKNPTGKENYCVYKGSMYKTGQKWEDGCDFDCVCLDDMSGKYTCTERCGKFVNIPAYCVLVDDPADKCCKKPSCSQPNQVATPTPNVLQSPGVTRPPGQTPVTPPNGGTPSALNTPVPNPDVTPNPIPKDVCIYMGKAYTQGQQWYQGCQKVCVCDDAHTGLYSCNARCPSYQQDPACVMVPDPSDPMCCKIPKCDGTNNLSGVIGTITGNGLPPTPGPTPALLPGQTPPQGSQNTPLPGSLTPTPPKVCVYKGVAYKENQKWQDGCDFDCVCEDGTTGKYKCTARCPRFPNLDVNCVLAYDPMNPCCKKPLCGKDIPTPGPGFSTPGPVTTIYPVGIPGETPSPQFCVYNGVPFRQGQSWNEGCDKVCRCEDASTRQVNCDDRCPSFPNIPTGCSLATDPNDVCCHVVNCPTNPLNPTGVKGVPGVITGHAVPNTNSPNPYVTGNRDVCVYNGKVYKQGEQWNDGCTYNCECIDSKTGTYKCTEKCARYPPLPSGCTMVHDKSDVCCSKPFCPAPATTPSPLTPAPGQTTPSPGVSSGVTPQVGPKPKTPDVCVYKGQQYKQGQLWFDGCDVKCHCEDAKNNFYRCDQRCAKYPNIPAGCTLMPDPADPQCCEVPNCPITTPSPQLAPTPGFLTMTGNPKGVVSGNAPVPTPLPGHKPLLPGVNPTPNPQLTPGPGQTAAPTSGVTPLPKTGCYYKNTVYQQGQKWDDGCQLSCVCEDGVTGKYQCDEKCTKYPTLPNRCVLIQDPAEKCCKKPYCDFLNPTPFPNGIPTPAGFSAPTPNPGINPKASPETHTGAGTGENVVGGRGFCVYQGVYYTQGQTWQQGCSKTCRCEDVASGFYSCFSRCSAYSKVSANCKLVTDPSDSCCLVPDCNTYPVDLVHSPDLTGTASPGALPGTYNNITGTRSPILVPTNIPGSITGMGGSNAHYQPNFGGYGSGTRSVCVYKGQVYKQGQTWGDGCKYNCECVDGARGQYRCRERCPKYLNLPPQCSMHPDPNDNCCQKALCDFTPTLPPGASTVSTTTTPKPTIGVIIGKCIYKRDGSQHAQGEKWSDGCNYDCKCDDASKNYYTCDQKCQAFSSLPPYCHLEPDSMDQCCEKPVCTGNLTPLSGNNKPTASPTLTPDISNIVPLGTHNIFTGTSNPNYNPITGQTVGGRNVCVYKGHTYKQGDSWNDGCEYVCNCQDAKTGLYQCTSKCPMFPPLPSYCKMQTIPGQCCPSLTCNVPKKGLYTPLPELVPTPGPTPNPQGVLPTAPAIKQQLVGSGAANVIGGSNLQGAGATVPPGETVSGLRGVCVYKNKMYHQGETWKDGCSYDCECLDGRSGYYSCKPHCPNYDKGLPSNCYLVKAVSGCCETPMCKKPDGSVINPVQNPGVYPVFGSFNAGFSSFRPGYHIDQGTSFGHTSGSCVYKQTLYKQDQTWEDGCDFHCECINARMRQYRCTPKCPSYTNLPPPCRLEATHGCCKAVNCNPIEATTPKPHVTAPTGPDCVDKIHNCAAFGASACEGDYLPWAKINCRATCKICDPGSSKPQVSYCVDVLSNCAAYGHDSCVGEYETWAKQNCQNFCNYCPTNSIKLVTTTQTPAVVNVGECKDLLKNCAQYGNSSCVTPYEDWARKNCPAFCGYCKTAGAGVTGKYTHKVELTGGTSIFAQCNGNQEGVILMKGVAGASGDLYQLWAGPGTANKYDPNAMDLFSHVGGHYKPDMANDWDSCKFQKVELAIYKNGVKKAFIMFDTVGSTKTNWMHPSRILDSSFTDIKTAPHDVFSLKGDATSGREFYASSESNDCDAYGWIMVSTKKQGCFYEDSSSKPAFYYSPTPKRSHWGFTTPGEGDTLAIVAYGGPCINKNLTATKGCQKSGQCFYNATGKSYKTGESWQDGCTYNCTCVNGSKNFYSCTELCPRFSHLPKNCKLEKRPGQCCSTPVCFNFKGVCHYKGQTYNEGQTWDDGCDYTCTCVDGSSGFYQCKTKCLQWNLPKVCSLKTPPAGKCCPTPDCPSGYVINYPPGYKQE